MMETLKNTIFSFLGPDTFQIFIFEYSLTKKIAITQETQLLFPSSLDYIFSVSVPLGIKWKTYIEGVRGCHKKKKCSKMTLSRWKTSINNWKCIFLDSTSQRPLKDCWSWEGNTYWEMGIFITASGKILASGNLCFRLFKLQLKVINKNICYLYSVWVNQIN